MTCGYVFQQAPRPVLIWDTNSLRWNAIFMILERHFSKALGLLDVRRGFTCAAIKAAVSGEDMLRWPLLSDALSFSRWWWA